MTARKQERCDNAKKMRCGTDTRVKKNEEHRKYEKTSLSRCLSEESIELLHATLHKIGLAEVLAEGHVCQFGLLLLHGQKSVFYGVLDDILDSCDRFRLTKSMLHCGRKIGQLEDKPELTKDYARYDLPPDSLPQDS